MSDLDIAERRLPQDGKIKFKKYGPLDIELRVASIPTAGRNEDIVMRLLPTGEPVALDQMGMSEKTYNAFIDVITRPYGVVLCVGPTGSGKTTTLHSALRYINKTETKIWTAEDPVEIPEGRSGRDHGRGDEGSRNPIYRNRSLSHRASGFLYPSH
jgi:type II secretory ATPase GspE/PulE/Tfp pilus assembly ATPase PilB-like protein